MTTQAVEISIFIPSLRGGGAERSMLMLANGFAARGVSVDLVLVSAEGPYMSEVSSGVRIVDLKSKRVAASLPRLVQYLKRNRPKAMLSVLNYANVIAVVARGLARVPTRLVVSERTNVSRAIAGRQSLRQRLVPPLMRWTYKRADGIVAVSEGVADDLANVIAVPRENIDVVYNPVVTPDLKRLACSAVNHPWFDEGGHEVVLAVGRLAEEKDYPTLIQAFAQVRSQRDCRLVILGEGELRQSLEAQIEELGMEDYVQLPGFVDNPFAWMSKASIFVLSSAWEGLPNVLIQAMACGVPVVSTDCPSGPYEVLEAGKWGVLVPVGDVAALADAMLLQLKHPQEWGRSRQRSEFFNLENAVEGYLRVLFRGA